MKKNNLKNLIIAILVAAIVVVSVLAIVFGMDKTYSAFTRINVPDGDEVSVYISGNGVTKTDGGYYTANVGSTVTVTVVNESKLFVSMKINGGDPYFDPVATVTLPETNELTVEVETKEPYAEDIGKYFGNPFILNNEADVLAVARILADRGTKADYDRIGAQYEVPDDVRYGYFRLGTNLFISSSEFFGLGYRGGLPFGGCFDFDGYTATINVVRTSHVQDEFSFDDNGVHTADYGFFAFVYGDGKNPCLIRNAKVQGFIGLNTMDNVESISHVDHVNAGGIAGTLGKNVVLDGIESTVSVTAQTRFADLYLGGIFGICSSSVDSWCDVRYDGAFNDISAVTYGEKANAVAGAYAGVIQNAGVNGATIDAERSMILANALGKVSGSAVAGGFAGIIELGKSSGDFLSEPRLVVFRNIALYAELDFSVSAVIDNSNSQNKGSIDPDSFMGSLASGYTDGGAAAVAGGVIGIANRGSRDGSALDDSVKMEFSDIYFERTGLTGATPGAEAASRLMIKASTQDGNSSGAVFAGGTVGYIYSGGNDHIVRRIAEETEIKYLFNCSADITAVQNGVGPAYAGGAFGYNAFHLVHDGGGTLKLGVVSPGYDYTVSAIQSSTSTKAGNKFYNVCAGGYTSRFNVGFDSINAEFHIDNGKISAYREVGSTAIGDVNAGGIAGRVLGSGSAATTINSYDSSSSQSGEIDNVKVYFSDNSRIEASCYSYDSVNDTNYLGNNVCAGGAFGYVLGYKSINNLTVAYDKNVKAAGDPSEYFVFGTQNGANVKDDDVKTEGFVGGAFGLVIDTVVTNVSVSGDETENSVVYFISTNSPNTASVGGLIGSMWRRKIAVPTAGLTMLDGASVKNVHAAGKAYCDKDNSNDTYDIYVGGALGVLATPVNDSRTIAITNLTVDGCVVDAIGENTMLTYAGGIVAGMWYSKWTKLTYGVVTGSAITASSINPYAYSGGIVGLMQYTDISYCLTQDTEVKAVSEQSNAYAAGIAARAKTNDDKITYCYSNASLKAQGKDDDSSKKFGIIAQLGKNTTGDSISNASKNFFVYETAGEEKAYSAESSPSRALYLDANKTNRLSIASGASARIYSAIDAAQSGVMSIKSHDKNIAEMSGLNVVGKNEGVAYLSAYCTLGGKEYLLCSYPVTVNNAIEAGSGLTLATDDGKLVLAQKTDAYIEYTHGSGTSAVKYIYFRRNIGNPDTVKKVNAVPLNTEYFSQSVNLYDITGLQPATYFTDATTAAEKEERIKAIIAAKGDPCDVSAFNGRANVGFNYADGGDEGAVRTSAYFYANDNVRENTIIVLECTYGGATYGVIVEFVPNQLTGIVIEPEKGTPPLDVKIYREQNPISGKIEDVTHYIYTAGDVVRFNATLTYFYPAPRSYVVETIYEGTDVTANGMVVVKADGVYGVTCRDLKRNVFTYVVVEAKEEVGFSFSFSGGDGSSDRKMVSGSEFLFSVRPQPGYGLKPTISVTVGGNSAVGTFTDDGFEVVINSRTFVFVCNADDTEQFAYDFTADSEFVDYVAANGKNVEFSVTYSKIYSLVFISNYNGNDFFSTTVASGEKFADVRPEGFEEWTNSLVAARYGYDFEGYYTLSKAGDVSAYGKSFEDMQNDGVSAVSGTMRFYARWTYNVTVLAPENVKVSSSMSASMLSDGKIIPLDTNNGFGFVIETPAGWQGKPRFAAFVRKSDGTDIDITAEFSPASQENGYYVSSEVIERYGSGYIFIRVYADALGFSVGDDPKYDGNALYTDGIFTVDYTVNYGSKDAKSEYVFAFSPLSLPAKTSVRLYYIKNGTAAWSGQNVLAAATNRIAISGFTSLGGDGGRLTDGIRSGATNERFIVVVTLPDNSNEFGITSEVSVSVSVSSYAYDEQRSDYGAVAESATGSPSREGDTAESAFTLCPAVIREVAVSGNTFAFTETGSLSGGVTDHRHNGVRYMWRIEKTGGGYIGSVKFGGLSDEVVRTTDAIYYYASLGEVTITGNLDGYTVSLIAAKNVRQPAGSPVIFSQSFGK